MIYGEPYKVIPFQPEVEQPLELVATVGPDKIRVPILTVYQKRIRPARYNDLASAAELARRIAACVNACEGMTTEELEAMTENQQEEATT